MLHRCACLWSAAAWGTGTLHLVRTQCVCIVISRIYAIPRALGKTVKKPFSRLLACAVTRKVSSTPEIISVFDETFLLTLTFFYIPESARTVDYSLYYRLSSGYMGNEVFHMVLRGRAKTCECRSWDFETIFLRNKFIPLRTVSEKNWSEIFGDCVDF